MPNITTNDTATVKIQKSCYASIKSLCCAIIGNNVWCMPLRIVNFIWRIRSGGFCQRFDETSTDKQSHCARFTGIEHPCLCQIRAKHRIISPHIRSFACKMTLTPSCVCALTNAHTIRRNRPAIFTLVLHLHSAHVHENIVFHPSECVAVTAIARTIHKFPLFSCCCCMQQNRALRRNDIGCHKFISAITRYAHIRLRPGIRIRRLRLFCENTLGMVVNRWALVFGVS